jgi:S-adenosylmethionine-diacylgycerolhomoserine-N-methlytransferase
MASDAYDQSTLKRFYGWHAPIYDWTRPLILFGRGAVLEQLETNPGGRVLDVGCGTGWSLPRLARRGIEITAIDCVEAMLDRARARVASLGPGADRVTFDPTPYGSHSRYQDSADAVLFSYSLSMIPPFEQVLASARRDLRPRGRVAVVDFLEARNPIVRRWLEANHVALGFERVERLRALFPAHRLHVRRTPLWSYYLFWGGAGS